MKNRCPICFNQLENDDRLVLEYLPQHDWWVMLHLTSVNKNNPKREYEHSRYPGFHMRCGQSASWQPEQIETPIRL